MDRVRYIHLLYVPTMQCNMRCAYCYLGDQTNDRVDADPVETLSHAVEKLEAAGVLPFNISLHGGEVTTLAPEHFERLIAWIDAYYAKHAQELTDAGFRVGRPHIKTNLLGLDRHIDTIARYQVSVSGSLDLPFSLHRQYRRDKGGRDTLDRILSNIQLMAELPNRKKVSATLFKEHFERLDELCDNIRWLHEHTCLDMNDFNFMIGFTVPGSPMTAMTEDEQVALYQRMRSEFENTELRPGLDGPWFAEFTQAYCTNCDVCGDKFFLLERSGDVYSCVRGQGDPAFLYGNIYRDSVEDILRQGHNRILDIHMRSGFSPDCAKCGHLSLCKTGCPYVKKLYGSPKSYTCKLQQAIYRDKQEAMDPADYAFDYTSRMHPLEAPDYLPPEEGGDGLPTLTSLIAADPDLQKVYDPDAFILSVENERYPLVSQLLKCTALQVTIVPGMKITLDVRKDYLDALSPWPVNNSLYIMLLSGDTVVYGDEGRSKQAHIMTHQMYRDVCLQNDADDPAYCRIDLTDLLTPYFKYLSGERPNNLFFTTAALRDYHYTKQKNNGFYHLRAMNLPFQNIEFYVMNLNHPEVPV